MSNPMVQLQEATIKAQCKTLRMPMVASQFGTLAEQAIREKQSRYRISRSTTVWPRSKSGNATRSNAESRKLICRE